MEKETGNENPRAVEPNEATNNKMEAGEAPQRAEPESDPKLAKCFCNNGEKIGNRPQMMPPDEAPWYIPLCTQCCGLGQFTYGDEFNNSRREIIRLYALLHLPVDARPLPEPTRIRYLLELRRRLADHKMQFAGRPGNYLEKVLLTPKGLDLLIGVNDGMNRIQLATLEARGAGCKHDPENGCDACQLKFVAEVCARDGSIDTMEQSIEATATYISDQVDQKPTTGRITVFIAFLESWVRDSNEADRARMLLASATNPSASALIDAGETLLGRGKDTDAITLFAAAIKVPDFWDEEYDSRVRIRGMVAEWEAVDLRDLEYEADMQANAERELAEDEAAWEAEKGAELAARDGLAPDEKFEGEGVEDGSGGKLDPFTEDDALSRAWKRDIADQLGHPSTEHEAAGEDIDDGLNDGLDALDGQPDDDSDPLGEHDMLGHPLDENDEVDVEADGDRGHFGPRGRTSGRPDFCGTRFPDPARVPTDGGDSGQSDPVSPVSASLLCTLPPQQE